MPHKKPIASETDARKMKSFARLGGLKEAPASIGGEYFTGWIGGKNYLKKQIISLIPENTERYIEVFGGAGWVLFGKEQHPKQMEVFNDIDGNLINLIAISIKFEHIDKICEVLDCTTEELFEYLPNKVKTTGKDLIVEEHGNRKKS